MTQYVINIGAVPNDGTGDPLRTAFNEVNLNFNQVWATGLIGSNIAVANNTIRTTNTNGNLVLAPNGVGIVQSNVSILPDQNRIRNLGSSTRYWDTVYAWYGEIPNANIGNASTINIAVANLHVSGGSNGYVLQTDGTGNLTWTAQTGGSGNGTPGGANTQVQFNNAGTFGGQAGFTFNKTSNTLAVSNITTTGNVTGGNILGNIQAANGNTSVMFNQEGFLGADAGFSYDYADNTLYVETVTIEGKNTHGDNALYVGVTGFTPLGSNVVAQLAGNADSYTQINFQNINDAPTASGDYIITANNGTDSSNFIDMGIAGNTWDGTQTNSLGTAVSANDGYLYVNGGNLVVGTYLNSGNVINTWKFNTNGTTIFPTLNVQRGDNPSGTIQGQTLLFGDNAQEAIISTPDGTVGNEYSQRLVINPGAGYDYGEGGDIYLWAGRGGDNNGSGGDVKIRGGQGMGESGSGGYIRMEGGDSQDRGYPGYINITAGYGANTYGAYVNITGGGGGNGQGGPVQIQGGFGAAGFKGGDANIIGGSSADGAGNYGNVNINSGGLTWSFNNNGTTQFPGNVIQAPEGRPITVNATNGNASTRLEAGSGYAQIGLQDDTTGEYQAWAYLETDMGNVNTPSAVVILKPGDTGTEVRWTYDALGNLNLPQGGYIGAAGVKGDGTMLTGGPGNIASLTSYYADTTFYSTCLTANPDGTLNITTYGNGTGQLGQWTFDATNLTLPYGAVLKDNSVYALAIGRSAGILDQGQNAVAIGVGAGSGSVVETGYVSGAYPSGTTLVVGDTTGIRQYATITGTGFTSGQIVLDIVDGSTLTISAVADSTPSGTLTFSAGPQQSDSVAIGTNAGQYAQQRHNVAIGTQAGMNNQGEDSVAIGWQAGRNDQTRFGIAIGWGAGFDHQGQDAQAYGKYAGGYYQQSSAIAIGETAGRYLQKQEAIAIGYASGYGGNYGATVVSMQASNVVRLNSNTYLYPGMTVVGGSITPYSGITVTSLIGGEDIVLSSDPPTPLDPGNNLNFYPAQSSGAIAIGSQAAQDLQGQNAVAVGYQAGRVRQGLGAVAIGEDSGGNYQSANAISIGNQAGYDTQGVNAVAIGYTAGLSAQGNVSVAIGNYAGQSIQGQATVAMGFSAGRYSQGNSSVALGEEAGYTGQGQNSIAIGRSAGQTSQGNAAIAMGWAAAQTTQGNAAVAIGEDAGRYYQGEYSIAIGYQAGYNTQGNNSIVLNASGGQINGVTANTFTVKPIRNAATGNVLYYDELSGEITFDVGGGGLPLANGTSNINIATANSNVTITANAASTWTFDTAGNLTVPGGMIINGNINTLGTQTALLQPTDNLPLSFIASGANGSVTSFWAEDFANLMTSNIAAIYTPLQNTQTVRIVTGSNGGNIAIYDFDKDGMFTAAAVSATGNVTGGNLITSGSGGNITLTGGNITGANVVTANVVNSSVSANISNVTINSYTSVPKLWFKGQLSAAQNVTTTTDTVTIWNNNSDPLGWGNVSTGYIVPNKAGWYEVTSRVQFNTNAAANSQNQINHQIAVNGAQAAISQSPNFTGNVPLTMISTAMVELNGTTDYITTTSWSAIAGNAQQINGGNTSMILVRWVSN